jgi:hypothetical protein
MTGRILIKLRDEVNGFIFIGVSFIMIQMTKRRGFYKNLHGLFKLLETFHRGNERSSVAGEHFKRRLKQIQSKKNKKLIQNIWYKTV